jgi:hypothetical protein
MLGGQRIMDFQLLNKMDESDMLAELVDPAGYRGYLQTMSHFSSYSWRNVFLIFKQVPNASKLADYDTWKNQYGRTIIRDSTAIRIKVPVPQEPVKKMVTKTDPTTGTAVLDENGKRIMVEVITEAPMKFKQSNFFDISQTKGAPVPVLAGDVLSDESLNRAFTDVLKTMSFSDEQADIYSMVRQIVLGKIENNVSDKNGLNIDSIIFVVCRRFGVETDIDFIGLDRLLDADALETIVNQSDGLITDIESRFAAVCKERGLDPMTLYDPAEPSVDNSTEPPKVITAVTSSHNGTKLDNESKQAVAVPYIKELRTAAVTGVEFSQYHVKPISTGETVEKAQESERIEPMIQSAQTTEATTQSTPLTPQFQPTEKSKPVKPTEPPTLKHPPDTSITITERNQYGYTRPELLPLNKDRAIVLFRREMTIFLLHKDNTEVIALYDSDIHNHNGIFGVAYNVWQNSREYIGLASGNPEDRLEAKFIFDTGDSFAVYQTEPDKSSAAYKSYEELQKNELSIDRRQYHLIYTAPLPDPPSDTPAGIFMWVTASEQLLDGYKGRAMAISDILSIKKDGVITSHYANGRTFKQLLDFVGEEGRGIVRVREKGAEVKEIENAAYSSSVMENTLNDKQTSETVVSNTSNDEAVVVATTEQPHQSQPQNEQSATSAALIETTLSSEVTPEQTATVQTAATQTASTQSSPPALPEIRTEVSVYKLSFEKADEYGVTDTYDLSRRTDIDCAEAIDKAIKTNKKNGNRYDLATPTGALLERYGKERMTWVLSKHILFVPQKFSEANISWTKEFVNEELGTGDEKPTFTLNTHHAVLEAFINQFRKLLDRTPTFDERMKAAKKKSEAFNKSNG